MLAVMMKVSFNEAHFRAHFTEMSPLTYPAPLPSTVAGMFGALMSWSRSELRDKCSDLLFGAKLLGFKGFNTELARIIQYEKGRPVVPFPIMKYELLMEPELLIVMAGNENVINRYLDSLRGGYGYLPYGGRNEYFVRDIELVGAMRVTYSMDIQSYAPENWVTKVDLLDGGWVRLLQVNHNIQDASRWFSFVYGGTLHLKKEVPVVEGICLYRFTDFPWCLP